MKQNKTLATTKNLVKDNLRSKASKQTLAKFFLSIFKLNIQIENPNEKIKQINHISIQFKHTKP